MVGQMGTAGCPRILCAPSPGCRAVLFASFGRHEESTTHVQPVGTRGSADLVGGGCRGSHGGLAARTISRKSVEQKPSVPCRTLVLLPSSQLLFRMAAVVGLCTYGCWHPRMAADVDWPCRHGNRAIKSDRHSVG